MKASDFDILIPQPVPEQLVKPRWGVVTQASPLRVRLDGDDTALPVTPASLVSGLSVADRVWTMLSGRQLVVLGAWGFGGDPVGVVKEYAGSVAPEGWLLCQGQAVSRSQYPRLFAVLGTAYGAGDGSTTFNVPDRRGRVGVGVDPTQPEFATLGQQGGSKTHTLTEAQMPAHAHSQTVSANAGSGGTGVRQDYDADGTGYSAYPQGTSTSPAGGGGAHNNLQPYVTTNYIIKT